jgi:hypothetical protein
MVHNFEQGGALSSNQTLPVYHSHATGADIIAMPPLYFTSDSSHSENWKGA